MRVNRPRWTRDPIWIPEQFRQNAVNKTRKPPPTNMDRTTGYLLMYLNRKISDRTCYGLLMNLSSEVHADDVAVHSLILEALGVLGDYYLGKTDEVITRANISNVLHHDWENANHEYDVAGERQ